ncbi:alpha/beta hydrolase [Pseudomonas xanthosomatis]|uniref:alpha/beta fold hydrolase n=1 Tax=Pseudomonas xanthosomatis TaxID=2842356 RepID=UPI001C3E519E|nr:alpha/beta hydrolase [Pseudomonas xanthosomatis]QXH43900.1 alpha/beta hydrolase [Pseudomonas xanthosomatis]
MELDIPVVLVNGLIGCLDHPALHQGLHPRPVIAPDLLGYGTLQGMPAGRIDIAATPVHLLAGEHSRSGWDVPHWAAQQAASVTVLPGVGHLMMLEDPQGFAQALARLLA